LLYETGVHVIEGLANGIAGMAGAVGSAIGRIVSGIAAPVRKLLGISSPSKVFHGFGVNIVEGLVNGITANTHKVSTAATKMAIAAKPIFPSTHSTTAAGTVGGVDVQAGGTKVLNLFPGASIDFAEHDPNTIVQRLQNAVVASRM
jgi:hypothetical protein